MKKEKETKKELEIVKSGQEMSMENIITRAIDKKIPVETMERLLEMRNKLKAEFARDEFNRAMANFQAECPTIKKTKEVMDKYGKRLYVYAPLESIVEQVKNLIAKNGLSYSVQTKVNGTIKSICSVKHLLGHSESSEFEVPLGQGTQIMSAPQKVASAATFAKRYAFCNAFGIMTGDEDNDANIITDNPKAAQQAVQPKIGEYGEPLDDIPVIESEAPTSPFPTNKCSKCGVAISVKVKEFSLDKYKKILCMDCQKLEEKK